MKGALRTIALSEIYIMWRPRKRASCTEIWPCALPCTQGLYIKTNQLGAQAYGAMKMYLTSLKIDREVLSLENYDLEPKIASSVSDSTNGDDNDAMQIEEEGAVTAFKNLYPRFTLAGFSDTIHMDAPTLNNLELAANANDGTEKGSLLSFLNKASTPAGKRLLRKWTAAPLVCTEDINCRLQAVTTLLHLEKNLGDCHHSQHCYHRQNWIVSG